MNRPDSVHIDGNGFARALTSGIHRVVGQQEYLNKINVFPVADSDTGTNLSLSLSAALGILGNSDEKHLGTMLAGLADTLLDNARGNSGAIIAQFFQGMSDAVGDATRLTIYTFSKAVGVGSEYAHDALSEPRDGTVLSAISAFAASLAHQVAANPDRDLAGVLLVAQQRVNEAVAETPKQLDVLRKAGVVDAGAKGFAELVEGIADYFSRGEITPWPESASLGDFKAPVAFAEADNSSQYRFCTECLVTASDIDRRKLRETLTELGDSFVLAGSKRKAKIHIHVDDPDEVFERARTFGVLSGEKVDDMHRQQHSTHNRSRAFAVVTDSGADIRDEDMERLDIHMVPCRIQFGDRGYMDKVSITTDEFYRELAQNPQHPSTSQPAPGDYRRQFQFLASHFNDVLAISLTSRASGTYEGARASATRVEANGRIHVIDSLNASVGQGQLVVLAAECAEAGMSVEMAKQIVARQIPKTRTFALLKDLRYAKRGGRLPQWVKTMADVMRLTPVICVKPDGRIGLATCLFGRRNRVRKFARFIAKHLRHGERSNISIGQAICPEDAADLATLICDESTHVGDIKICDLGTAIGVHGGPGTLIVSLSPAVSCDHFSGRID